MKEIIQIHIGQCGCQVANACWELFCLEHGIYPDGHVEPKVHSEDISNPFFYLTGDCKAVPRVVMVDLESSVVDEIRTGSYRCLFHPNNLISGKEDAASNFARGFYTIGQEFVYSALDRIRLVAETCDELSGFIVYRSYGGGTGGGFGTLLLEQLQYYYSSVNFFEFAIHPSPQISPVIVEPYNAVFTSHGSMDVEDVCCIFDNQALYAICARLKILKPTYTQLNRLLAQVVSATTMSFRYEGQMLSDMTELKTNVVPYSRIHYPLVTLAPIRSLKDSPFERKSVEAITYECFEPHSQMVRCNTHAGRYVSCCLIYRGDCSPKDVNDAIAYIKASRYINFVDWTPCMFKVAITRVAPMDIMAGDFAPGPRAVCMLGTNSAVRTTWVRLVDKFNLMYNKRAFVHHYIGEGMEEAEFRNARENILALIDDYREVES